MPWVLAENHVMKGMLPSKTRGSAVCVHLYTTQFTLLSVNCAYCQLPLTFYIVILVKVQSITNPFYESAYICDKVFLD